MLQPIVQLSCDNTARHSLWSDLGQALRDRKRDYTRQPINRSIVLLAIPMILELLMESLFAVVDVFWVSRLGSDAVAVVGLTEALMTLVYALAIGGSLAATAVVARRIGEQDQEGAAQAAGQILLLGIATSALLGIILAYFAADLLGLMGATSSVVALGSDFARLMLGGNVSVFMIFLINAIFRGTGDAVIAMRTLWLANALNMVLSPSLIFGWGPMPELGVTGAAVATNIGRGIGILYQVWHLFGDKGRLCLRARHLRPSPPVLKRILAVAGTGAAQLLVTTTSWVALFKILALSGSAALAGYVIAMRIVNFALLPALGVANAASTLVGQNLGASLPDRAASAVTMATRFNVVLCALVGAIFVFFSEPLAGLFTTDAQVLSNASRALWIVCLGFPLYAAGMCLAAAFNGAGDTWTPTRVNFVCFWLGQIPVAWVLARQLTLGPNGVYIAVLLSFSAVAIWNAYLFRCGRWKIKQL